MLNLVSTVETLLFSGPSAQLVLFDDIFFMNKDDEDNDSIEGGLNPNETGYCHVVYALS